MFAKILPSFRVDVRKISRKLFEFVKKVPLTASTMIKSGSEKIQFQVETLQYID